MFRSDKQFSDLKIPKYEQVPTSDQGNYLLVSMQDDIVYHWTTNRNFLKNFPRLTESNKIGCSTTLLWTGESGYNIPIDLYCGRPLGIVLDTRLVEIPYAGFVSATGSKPPKEVSKASIGSTKYPSKCGRLFGGMLFETNLARHEHLPDTPEKKKQATYHKQGSVNVFAGNIWRKFHKRPGKYIENNNRMKLNEAIVFQKTAKNPVAGVIVNVKGQIDNQQMNKLSNIFIKNNQLILFLYNPDAKEHMIRYIDNKTLYSSCGGLSFEEMFEQALPFKGFAEISRRTFEQQLDEFKALHLASSKKLGNVTSLTQYDALTILRHAQEKTLFGHDNRTMLILKGMGLTREDVALFCSSYEEEANLSEFNNNKVKHK